MMNEGLKESARKVQAYDGLVAEVERLRGMMDEGYELVAEYAEREERLRKALRGPVAELQELFQKPPWNWTLMEGQRASDAVRSLAAEEER